MAEVTDPLTDGFGVVPARDWRGGLQNKAYFDLHRHGGSATKWLVESLESAHLSLIGSAQAGGMLAGTLALSIHSLS